MAPLVISTLALIFTVYGFWWMNWRPAVLSVAKPRSFAIWRSHGRELLRIRLPLVFLNSGARPIVVHNLRLQLPGLSDESLPLTFNSTASALEDEDSTLAIQFPVRSREAVVAFCDFVRRPGNVLFRASVLEAELQGVVGDRDTWTHLISFQLLIPEATIAAANREGHIAIDNYLPPTGGEIAIREFPGSV